MCVLILMFRLWDSRNLACVKMDTASRMNRPSSMKTPHIGWLFDKYLDKSDIEDVFDGAVLEINCDEEMDTLMSSHVYSAPGIETN